MAFRVKFGEQSFTLPAGESLIGRDATCRIQLNHRSVSRRHARILLVGGQPSIEDLASRNGTFLNGEPIRGSQPLPEEAQIKVGTQSFTIAQDPDFLNEQETEQAQILRPSYQVPEMRTCVGCRHLVGATEARCPLCGIEQRRPSEVAMTVRLWDDPKGRRASRRFPTKLRGLYVSPLLTVECEISNLSLTGAFVKADLLDEPHTPCDLVIFIAKDDVVRLTAQVARIDHGKQGDGMGLQFGDLGPAATLWVTTVIAMIERQT